MRGRGELVHGVLNLSHWSKPNVGEEEETIRVLYGVSDLCGGGGDGDGLDRLHG